MKINSDKCEVIQKNGEKIVLRLSKVLGYKQYIKVTLDFAKWAFSTKAHRESERLKKIQIKNIIRNEVRRNELFLFMTGNIYENKNIYYLIFVILIYKYKL